MVNTFPLCRGVKLCKFANCECPFICSGAKRGRKGGKYNYTKRKVNIPRYDTSYLTSLDFFNVNSSERDCYIMFYNKKIYFQGNAVVLFKPEFILISFNTLINVGGKFQ